MYIAGTLIGSMSGMRGRNGSVALGGVVLALGCLVIFLLKSAILFLQAREVISLSPETSSVHSLPTRAVLKM